MTTLSALESLHGERWIIRDGAGGGFYAVRRLNLGSDQLARGLSAVLCGLSVSELAKCLDEETRREERPARPRLRRVS